MSAKTRKAPAKATEPTIVSIQTQLRTYVEQLYANANVDFKPCYPFCLVRCLDRERQVGRIITPEKQKKTTIEGIVLATFKPFEKYVTVNGVRESIRIESQLTLGDHILFPHYEGIPVPADEYGGEFRFVPEIFAYYGAERNGVIAKLSYESPKTVDWLRKMILAISEEEDLTTFMGARALAEFLLQHAEVFPHNRESLTSSPRTGAKE